MRDFVQGSAEHEAAVSGTARSGSAAAIVTRGRLAASPDAVWRALMFYEQVETPPPLYLRALLPMPLGTQGDKTRVGGEVRCLYDGGHLVKRITRIEPDRRYCFEVVEQDLPIGAGLALLGGSYALRELPRGRTELAVTTHYASPRFLALLRRPFEALCCHLFHRFLLRSVRRRIGSA